MRCFSSDKGQENETFHLSGSKPGVPVTTGLGLNTTPGFLKVTIYFYEV